MKVLFTSRGGHSGTWRMRGIEMASAKPDWRVVANANKYDLRGVDAVVLIKRMLPETLHQIRQWGGPFFYDALDFWRQPLDDISISSIKDIKKVFFQRFKNISPHVILCTNTAMAKDIAQLGYRTEVHYHHYDSKLIPYTDAIPNSILYWGRIRYLGEWQDIMRKTCKKLGKTFICCTGKEPLANKPEYKVEAMFAVRGKEYGTWLAKRWKSGVKGVTAERLGLPFIAMREQSYIEQASKNLFPFKNKEELESAIIKAFKHKDKDHIRIPSTEYSLENCANKLEKTIERFISHV